jgi:hypothetical protein
MPIPTTLAWRCRSWYSDFAWFAHHRHQDFRASSNSSSQCKWDIDFLRSPLCTIMSTMM